MTAVSGPAAPGADWAFRVQISESGSELYSGDLSGLASRLKSGALLPAQVPLLRLARELLAWAARFATLHPDTYAEVLPGLAGVIALKARLLLPVPEAELPGEDFADDREATDWENSGVLEGVRALEQLDLLVQMLSQRRQARQGLIPAARLELGLPRRSGKAGGQGLARLVRAAQNAVRDVQVPLLSVERLTLQDALKALRAFARRLSIFTFGAVPAQDWGERSTYFSALLEGVKAGDFVTEQLEMYGEIVVARPGAATLEAGNLEARHESDALPAPKR